MSPAEGPGATKTPARAPRDDGGRQRQPVDEALAPAARYARRRIPLLLAVLVLLAGLIDIGSVLTGEIRGRLSDVTDLFGGPFVRSAGAAALVVGVVLVVLSHGLRRRKRRAWRAAAVLLLASAVLDVLKGLDVEEAVFSLVVLGLLVGYRAQFRAAGDPRTRLRAVGAFVALFVASVVIGEILIAVQSDHILGTDSVGAQLAHVVEGLVGVHGPLSFTSDRYDDFVSRVLFALGLLTAVVTIYLALRPAEPVARLGAQDEERMRGLLARHGERDSLGYFALRRDKSVLWSASGKSAIAYRVVSGVLLASGDPLGDPEAWPGAQQVFLELAAAHAWTPAVMGCSEEGATAWSRAGLDALEFGDEAVVEVAEFSLEGRAMRNVRQAVARVDRAGYVFAVARTEDLTPQARAEIRRQAAAWRGAETERGFSMALGRFGDPDDPRCVVATASHADGRLAALLHFAPWGPAGLSLDLMRRDREADNGLNEFLIVRTLAACPELGVCRVSLNFAVFRSALARGERIGAGFVLRGWRNLLVFASRWFQIESLYRFNAKFGPVWEPRFVCYPAARDIPRIAIAALEAEAFIVWPRPSLKKLSALLGRADVAARQR